MRCVTVPAWDELSAAPPVLALSGLLKCDARPGLFALWSWVDRHGYGPHLSTVLETIAEWRGEAGVLSSALVSTGWATHDSDRRVIVARWQDVVGAPTEETAEERRRRQTRDRVRKHREYARGGVTPRNAPVTLGNANSVTCNADVTLCNAESVTCNAPVTLGNVTVTQNSVTCNAPDAPKQNMSLFSEVLQSKNQKQKKNSEEEQKYVVSIPAPVAPAGLAASGGLSRANALSAAIEARLAEDPGADLSDLIFTTDFDDMPEERPALAPQSTNDAPVRSVPVPTPDRAPEGDSGRPASKRSRSKKATVDATRVDPDVRAVWDAYAETVGTRVVLSAARVDLIAARLADGWTVDDLSTACRGYGLSPFHNGENDRGQRYQTIELWLRDAAHVEAGLGYARSPPASKATSSRAVSIEEKWRLLAEEYGDGEGGINLPPL